VPDRRAARSRRGVMHPSKGFGCFFRPLSGFSLAIPADVAGETADGHDNAGIFLKPLHRGSDTLAFGKSGFDFGPERPELTSFGVGFSHASSCEAVAGFGGPVIRQIYSLKHEGNGEGVSGRDGAPFFRGQRRFATDRGGWRQFTTVVEPCDSLRQLKTNLRQLATAARSETAQKLVVEHKGWSNLALFFTA
jgi:hypothetical protein